MNDRERAGDGLEVQRVTYEGVRGTVQPLSSDSSRLVLSLDDGRTLIATPETLQRQDDGSLVVATGTADVRLSSHVEAVIPVIREELAVSKRLVELERGVRVSKSVTQREEEVVQLLYRESLEVERIPKNEMVDRPPPVRHEGQTLVIPVCEEVLVLEKRLLLKEEIRVGRREQHVRHAEKVVLRTEHASIERFGDDDRSVDTQPSAVPPSRRPPHTS